MALGGWRTTLIYSMVSLSAGKFGGHQNFAQFRADGREPKPTWDDIDPAQDAVVIEIEETQVGQRTK